MKAKRNIEQRLEKVLKRREGGKEKAKVRRKKK